VSVGHDYYKDTQTLSHTRTHVLGCVFVMIMLIAQHRLLKFY